MRLINSKSFLIFSMIILLSSRGICDERTKSQTWEKDVKQLLYNQDVKYFLLYFSNDYDIKPTLYSVSF